MQPRTSPDKELRDGYPNNSRARDRWVLARRPARHPVAADQPHASLWETERTASGQVVATAAIFLTNRECPWRCLMCDLWRSTLTESVPPGAIPRQIDYAFEQLGIRPGDPAAFPRQVKLYNAGSFFDPRAIPPADYGAIANRVHVAERVIVECHPALVGEACVRFRDMLVESSPSSTRLEVAMGLETAHPEVLARLNKRMTLDQFWRAAEFLHRQEIALRVFVLVKPPFLEETEALEWAQRSIDFAFGAGASVVSLIPTRGGNGALEALERLGQFAPPRLSTLESAQAYGIGLHRGRVFADLWDMERFSDCAACLEARRSRLHRMNLEQVELETIRCVACADRQRQGLPSTLQPAEGCPRFAS